MTKRRQTHNKVAILLASLIALTGTLHAKGTGTSGGLTLIESPSARASSMGEAFSAMTNDISAFGYNPASLQSLEHGQASFMYQQGLVEDAFGQFMIGGP